MKTKINTHAISQSVSIVTMTNKVCRTSIGYRKINRMIQVAVSFCAPEDKWSAKIGRSNVFDRLEYAVGNAGNYDGVISLPLGDLPDETIQEVLADMFFDLQYS
jgi:hypothetical protein